MISGIRHQFFEVNKETTLLLDEINKALTGVKSADDLDTVLLFSSGCMSELRKTFTKIDTQLIEAGVSVRLNNRSTQ